MGTFYQWGSVGVRPLVESRVVSIEQILSLFDLNNCHSPTFFVFINKNSDSIEHQFRENIL